MTVKTPKEEKNIVEVYNTEITFSRILYLHSTQKAKVNDLFPYETLPIPTALFKDTGKRRYPTSKTNWKNALKAEVSVISENYCTRSNSD